MKKGGKAQFKIKLIYSKDILAEKKIEQVFQYILNINNEKKDEETRNCLLEKSERHQPSKLSKAQ